MADQILESASMHSINGTYLIDVLLYVLQDMLLDMLPNVLISIMSHTNPETIATCTTKCAA